MEDLELAKELAQAKNNVVAEIEKVIVGQNEVIEDLLVALFSKGHCLFVGVPGLAKTLLVSTLAQVLKLKFSRIQFTPDLMPSDITGTDILHEDQATGKRSFQFIKGPIFSNIILADEINRTPPKTQAALLQAMQEKQVTVGGNDLPPWMNHFWCSLLRTPSSTKAPTRFPEAQLDRFMFIINVTYPTREQEVEIALSTTSGSQPRPTKSCSTPNGFRNYKRWSPAFPVSDHVANYAVDSGAKHPPQSKWEFSQFRQRMDRLGCRPPCLAIPHPGSQSPRPDGRPRHHHRRRRQKRRPPGPGAPHHPQLQSRSGKHHPRRYRREAAGECQGRVR